MQRKVGETQGNAKPTGMNKIARVAGVSVTTVSLALNNHKRVSARTKLRVMQAASAVGYVANHAARRLARSRFARETNPFDQVGFVFFDRMGSELDGVYLSMLRGAEHQLSTLGATMTFVRVSRDADRDKVTRLVSAGWVDGWLLAGAVNDSALDLVQGSNLPCVVLGGHQCARALHRADIHFAALGQLAVRHLAGLGHSRVGFIGGSMLYSYQWETLNGFRTAQRELGLDPDESLIQVSRTGETSTAADKLRALLSLRPLPTAIVTAEHAYASSVLELLRQYEMQVPGEISLLGLQLDCTGPNITRIEQPFSEVGRGGASLLREVAGQPQMPARLLQISPVLLEGWSCGQPKPGWTGEPLVRSTTKESQT